MEFSCEKREIYFGVMMVHDVAGRSKSFSGRYERPERRRLRRGLSNVSLWLDYIKTVTTTSKSNCVDISTGKKDVMPQIFYGILDCYHYCENKFEENSRLVTTFCDSVLS